MPQSTTRENAPSFNPIPRNVTLRSSGLYAGRSVASEDFAGVITDVAAQFEEFTPRDHFHINEVNKPEVYKQRAIGTVTLGAAQTRVNNCVRAIHHARSARIERISLVPIRRDESTLVVVDLDTSSQRAALTERGAIIYALESFAPGAEFVWQRFKNPGVPVGNIEPGTSDVDQKEIKRRIIAGLPRSFLFDPAELLPKIKERS